MHKMQITTFEHIARWESLSKVSREGEEDDDSEDTESNTFMY